MRRLLTFVIAFMTLRESLAAALPSKDIFNETLDFPASKYFERNLDPRVPGSEGASVAAIRYGPYNVSAMGMLDTLYSWNIQKPCEDCYVVAMQADLQYEDGRSANIDEGAWLHHIVLYNGMGLVPNAKRDMVCGDSLFQTVTLGAAHRIFASGNERLAVRLNGRYKYGMPVDQGDEFTLMYDLVNQSQQPHSYYIQIIYEWVPRATPGYAPARMVWMDVVGCGDSETPAHEGFYEIRSPPWKSKVGGVMLATTGHVHDGGEYTTIYINNRPVCISKQYYGTNPAYVEKGNVSNLNIESTHGGHGNMQIDASKPQDFSKLHISQASSCVNFGVLNVDDYIQVGATYNTTAHSLNLNTHSHGMSFSKSLQDIIMGSPKYAPIMGLSPVYIAEGLMSL